MKSGDLTPTPKIVIYMTSRERIKHTLNFKLPDRVGVYDCLWPDTQRLWQEKGFIPKEQPYQDFFNYDLRLFEFNQSFLLIDKQEEKIKVKEDWFKFKPLLAPCDARIDNSFKIRYKSAKGQDVFLALAVTDPFAHAVGIFGFENLLSFLKDDPDFTRDVFLTSAELSIQMAEFLRQNNFVFDGAWLWADMAYNKGCYFSLKDYKNTIYPYHKKLCSYFNSKGMPVILHSDGDISKLIPLLLSAGVRALNPLQADCGFNIEDLKKEYGGDLVIFGNMPTDLLECDKEKIELVFSKHLETAKKLGGFIYHGDRPIPPTVSFANYEFALEVVKRYGSY